MSSRTSSLIIENPSTGMLDHGLHDLRINCHVHGKIRMHTEIDTDAGEPVAIRVVERQCLMLPRQDKALGIFVAWPAVHQAVLDWIKKVRIAPRLSPRVDDTYDYLRLWCE